MSHKKFAQTWASQTDIGKKFGLSAVAVGKLLLASGLRDPATKLATPRALEEGWCVATPLKTGELHYMWHIEKVRTLLKEQGQVQLCREEMMANELIQTVKSANRYLESGDDKLGYLMLESAFGEVPKGMRQAVGQWLSKKGYAQYAEGWLGVSKAA